MRNLCIAWLVVFFCDLNLSQEEIRLPPSITKGPPKQMLYRNDETTTLECKGKGAPAVTYEWRKNGLKVDQNLNNTHIGEDGRITIKSSASTDEGFYQCFASNKYGTALSNTTQLQRAFLAAASGPSAILQRTVQEGQPFHIQADAHKSLPKPTYGWQTVIDKADSNPTPLLVSRRIQIAENGDLHFAYARPEDDLGLKLYRSWTFNSFVDVSVSGGHTKVNVTRNASGITPFPPTLGYASEPETLAFIGGNVTLRCFFYGNPEPTISWTGPRNTLPIGRYMLNRFNTELIIYKTAATEEGNYSCFGSNTQGRSSHTLQIRVEAAPSFQKVNDGPRDVNVTEGDSYTFNCKTDAKPKATITWMENGIELDIDNPPTRFEFSNDNRSLTIRNVCRDCVDRESKTDLTVIQCNASNVHGYAFAQGYLNVISKTVVTIYNETEVAVNTNEAGHVQFDCRATSDPSNPPTIRWYKVESYGDRHLQTVLPFVIVSDGLLLIYVTTNPAENWPKYLGQYRCVAETGHTRVAETAYVIPVGRIPTENDLAWIWIVIGVAIFLLIIVAICGAVFTFRRKKTAERRNIATEGSRKAGGSAWTESSPLNDTIADDGGAGFELVQGVKSEHREQEH